jgi:hypothetical protein
MEIPITRLVEESNAGYIERNRRWLVPAVIGVVLLAGHAAGNEIASRSGAHEPMSSSITGWFVALAFTLAGVGTWTTDTISARVVARVAGSVALLGVFSVLVAVYWSFLGLMPI